MARTAIGNSSQYIEGSISYNAYISNGNIVVDAIFQMRRTNPQYYPYDTYSSTAVPKMCISGTSGNFAFVGSTGVTVHADSNWQTIFSATRTFDLNRGGESIYIGWKVENDNSGFLGGTATSTITLPTGSSAPTGLAISNISTTTNSVTATISISSWGVGGTTAQRYRELSVCTAQNITQRKFVKDRNDILSNAITVDNSATETAGAAFTISPNTRYYLTMYASNGALGTGNANFTPAITLAAAPTISLNSVAEDSAVMDYSVDADGGVYDKTIEYTVDGTNWAIATTITGGSSESGTFTITDLMDNTTYTAQTRVVTTAGTTAGPSVTFTTASLPATTKLYGSVNGEAKEVKKLYGSVQSTITVYTISSFDNNPNFNHNTFDSRYRSSYGMMTKAPLRIEPFTGYARLYFTDSTYVSITEPYTAWGFNDNTVYTGNAHATASYADVNVAKRIVKLYGSVNGSAKLLYEDTNA